MELVIPMSTPTLPERGLLVTPFEIAHLVSEAGAIESPIARFLQLDEVAHDPAYVGIGAASVAARAQSLGESGEREAFEALLRHGSHVVGGLIRSASLLIDDINSRRHLIFGTDGTDTVLLELRSEGWLSLAFAAERDRRSIHEAALSARHGFVLVATSGDGPEAGSAWDGTEYLGSLVGPDAWTTTAASRATAGALLDIELARLFSASGEEG